VRVPAIFACAALLLGAAAPARADCRPAAVPVGDPVLVQSLVDRLAASGIATAPAAGCPAVRVNVEQRGEQVHLRVVDAYQRLGERDVQDVATAAAIIESWTLQEIEPGALPPLPPPETPVAPAPSSPRFTLAAAPRSALGSDGSTWLGAGVDGCARVGWACLGAATTIAADTTAVNDADSGSHRSLAFDALATADAPRRLGRFTLRPGVVAGYGWSRIEQQHIDVHMLPQSVAHTTHALRVGARAVLALPVARSVAVFGELFADAAALRTAVADGPRGRAGLALGLRIEAP